MNEGERADWVERNEKRTLSVDERTLVELVCDAFRCGPYDLRWNTLRSFGVGAEVSCTRDLSTWDGNALTRLVVGAHQRCVRVSVAPCGEVNLMIQLWQRSGRSGRMSERHPTMGQALAFMGDPLTGTGTPWPLRDVLLKLADAADHLRTVHDCDAHGYEEVMEAARAARELAQNL